MEFVTIKDDENLSTVCRITEKSKELFIEQTLSYLSLNEWISDGSEEWGRTIGECLNETADSPIGVCILALGTNDSVATESFFNLILIGPGDCPECGNELERFGDGSHGKTWEVERCSCGYYSSTEPAWDESYEDA